MRYYIFKTGSFITLSFTQKLWLKLNPLMYGFKDLIVEHTMNNNYICGVENLI